MELADFDLSQTVRKRGNTIGIAQAAEEAEQPERKRRMKSKKLAKRPKKLKQQTLNLFLEDESADEQEESARGSSPGSRQAVSAEKTSTRKGF